MRIAAWFSIVIGALMVGQWSIFLLGGKVLETRTEPLAIAFHLAAEAGTAVLLIVSGLLILRHQHAGRLLCLLANGMLLYSIINSSGYFAQAGQWSFIGMFAVLLAAVVVAVLRLLMKAHYEK